MTKIKFCGLKRKADVDMANELLVDYAGFVFAKNSTRHITLEKGFKLSKMLDPRIKAVGVFVNEDVDYVKMLLEGGVIDFAQLHGTEDESYIKTLRQKTSKGIIQAFGIKTPEDINRANKSSADMVLLDTGRGGTGRTFDWSLLKKMKREYILAGGLNPENAEDAVLRLNPYGVDVSSGIETNGVKDHEKMRLFVEKVRRAGL